MHSPIAHPQLPWTTTWGPKFIPAVYQPTGPSKTTVRPSSLSATANECRPAGCSTWISRAPSAIACLIPRFTSRVSRPSASTVAISLVT